MRRDGEGGIEGGGGGMGNDFLSGWISCHSGWQVHVRLFLFCRGPA